MSTEYIKKDDLDEYRKMCQEIFCDHDFQPIGGGHISSFPATPEQMSIKRVRYQCSKCGRIEWKYLPEVCDD